MDLKAQILDHLIFLYGRTEGQNTWLSLEPVLDSYRADRPKKPLDTPEYENLITERDSMLITYADQFMIPGRPPLKTLNSFLQKYLSGTISCVHLLPFYPSTSDDGFSVADYRKVDPALGSWEDIRTVGNGFRLMFDAVINHVSRSSVWFQGFVEGKEPYTRYFIHVDPSVDLSMVFRPRARPLLTPVETSRGIKNVWTTFSEDQIDLNYGSPEVLLEVLDVLLDYVEKGASFIRLDAIAYLWKEIGTSCIHLPQTHHVIKLLRAVFDLVAPEVLLITETNVPHEENISYFGAPRDGTNRYDEAHLVYQFPLAPLLLHTFTIQNCRKLSNWASTLETPGVNTWFFNFIASHDGIGVMPARGLLSEDEIEGLVIRTLANGGKVSYKDNPDGSKSVYELNITVYDYLNLPERHTGLEVDRFLASQAIMLSLAGLPGIYVHSLFGSSNCVSCYENTGRARSLNREKFDIRDLKATLEDSSSLTWQIFSGYKKLISTRAGLKAFHPSGMQKVLNIGEQCFCLSRLSPDGKNAVLCLINVTEEPLSFVLPSSLEEQYEISRWVDVLSDDEYFLKNDQVPRVEMLPYQVRWLKSAK